jgi:Ca-activated chloride channel family protein
MEETAMKFAWPFVLIAAAVIPLLLVLLHRRSETRARRKLGGIIAPRLREQLLRSVDFGKRWRKVFIFAASMAALLIAVARPQMGLQTVEVERSSVDFIIALDLSRSMLAEDVEGKARLEAAKTGIGTLLDRLDSDRAGLIAFAGDAFLAAPVTQDHEAVKRQSRSLEHEFDREAGEATSPRRSNSPWKPSRLESTRPRPWCWSLMARSCKATPSSALVKLP